MLSVPKRRLTQVGMEDHVFPYYSIHFILFVTSVLK